MRKFENFSKLELTVLKVTLKEYLHNLDVESPKAEKRAVAAENMLEEVELEQKYRDNEKTNELQKFVGNFDTFCKRNKIVPLFCGVKDDQTPEEKHRTIMMQVPRLAEMLDVTEEEVMGMIAQASSDEVKEQPKDNVTSINAKAKEKGQEVKK